ncbi:MAG: glycosyltransferase [Candidatus Omnitrophota bacterium]|nr:glycosyltransferase [Candidatus Omnitrophota bacterium]
MPKQIRVAFFVYPSAFQNIGGGEILLLKTREYLEKEGIYCKLFDMWNDKLDDFDILHVIGAVKDCLGLMKTAKNKGVKIVLDPVFFSTFQRALYEQGSMKSKMISCVRHLTKVLFPYFPSGRRRMLLLADALVPNSYIEKRQLERLFLIDGKKMHVIPNCVDKSFAEGDRNIFISKYGIKKFVLSVGRIEPRKNQLNLIRALKGFEVPLVIIGSPVSDYKDYYDKCKSQGGGNVVFIERLGHEDPLLKSAYNTCACFVSQGWFETPGLAALEAGLAGAKIATTDKGCTKEYFHGFAEYFNPANPADIRRAVEKVLRQDKNDNLRNHIKKEFLWEVAARKNIEVYKGILKI